MIPVRVRSDAPLAIAALPPELAHGPWPDGAECPACDQPLSQGPVVLVLVGCDTGAFGVAEGEDGGGVLVHAACARLTPADLSGLPHEFDPDAPVTVAEVIGPLRADHPLTSDPCPVCERSLALAKVALVFIGFRAGTATDQPGQLVTGGAVAVHADHFALPLPEANH